MKIKDCTGPGVTGVHFKKRVDETPGNYKLHIIKSRTFYEDLAQPGRWWNGPNKLQEFDPKTLEPISREAITLEDTAADEFSVPINMTREQRKKQLEEKNFTDLRQEFQIPFERGLKKSILIERILDQEGLI